MIIRELGSKYRLGISLFRVYKLPLSLRRAKLQIARATLKQLTPLSRISIKLKKASDKRGTCLIVYIMEPSNIIEVETNKQHLRRLLARAEEFCRYGYWDSVDYLYRNKPEAYFQDIEKNHQNIMKKYLKDDSGDPKCPLNGKLKGLFFGVTLYEGHLPDISPFGDTRVTIPLNEAFDDSTNLYFADFFCLRGCSGNHSVLLVLTKDGSKADRFCKKYLLPLEPENNSFLRKMGNQYSTIAKSNAIQEVFYTEDVDLTGRALTRTDTFGQGHSTPGGIPKTPWCDVCNVRRRDGWRY